MAVAQAPYLSGSRAAKIPDASADDVSQVVAENAKASYIAASPYKMVSVYVGIPFCPSRCRYCSFPAFSLKNYAHLLDEYLQALSHEIESTAQCLSGSALRQTVIIGGRHADLFAQSNGRPAGFDQRFFCVHRGQEVTVKAGGRIRLTKKTPVMKKRRVSREHQPADDARADT